MSFSRDDVAVESTEAVYDGYFRIDRFILRHALHAGGMGPALSREVFDRGTVAAVLPVDPATDQVVLIEQFRPGAYAAGWDPWLLECVAGVVEPGETAEDVARRETEEEAGITLGQLEPIARFLTSPGATSETLDLFVGRVDASRANGIHGLASEGEDIRVLTLSIKEAVDALDRGLIVNAKTVIALHWLARHYSGLKTRWLHATE
jgi:ADP-ribose pyrophosphatase